MNAPCSPVGVVDPSRSMISVDLERSQVRILFIGFNATLYDYLLVFDDEVRQCSITSFISIQPPTLSISRPQMVGIPDAQLGCGLFTEPRSPRSIPVLEHLLSYHNNSRCGCVAISRPFPPVRNMPGREIANDTDTTFSRPSVSQLLAEICIQTLLPAIFLLSSDIFITRRWVRLFESPEHIV